MISKPNNQKLGLTEAQRNAIEYVRQNIQLHKERDLARISEILKTFDLQADTANLITTIRRLAKLTINFHPDRLLSDGRSVATALYEDGIYRGQFETKISNGGLTAFAGGDRDRWEEAMFGGAYQAAGVTEAERPKYGGLNVMNYCDGACPRFGSCNLRLKPDVLKRSTLTFGDSIMNPKDIGVVDAFEPVLAGLLEEIAANGNALGRKNVGFATFINALLFYDKVGHVFFHKTQGRVLDDYIEAQIQQIHGSLNLAADVEALVVDPSFCGTATGEILKATAERYGFPIERHPGFELTISEVPDDFRGSEMPLLAERVMENYAFESNHLDAAAIGLAAVSVVTSPKQWEDWGTARDTLQHIKYLWHILVAYGKPRDVIK